MQVSCFAAVLVRYGLQKAGSVHAAFVVVGTDPRDGGGAGQGQRLTALTGRVLTPVIPAAGLTQGADPRGRRGARGGGGDAICSSHRAQRVSAALLKRRADPVAGGRAGLGQRNAGVCAEAVRAALLAHGADGGGGGGAAVGARDALPADVTAEVVAAADVVVGTHPGDGGRAALGQSYARLARGRFAQPVPAALEGTKTQLINFRGAVERAGYANLSRCVFTQEIETALATGRTGLGEGGRTRHHVRNTRLT